jgi:hypothetical protein
MADLFDDEAVLDREVEAHGNFMLRLADQTWPAGLVVDELVRPLVARARIVHFPGYRHDWLPTACRAPDWAAPLAACMQDLGVAPGMAGTFAASNELREFWREGAVQHVEHDGKRRPLTHRPALPVLELPADAPSLPAFATFATSFLGFPVGRAKGHFATAMPLVRMRAEKSPGSVFVLYQDCAWLHFRGKSIALRHALSALRTTMRQQTSG